jgi:hypothetical protein
MLFLLHEICPLEIRVKHGTVYLTKVVFKCGTLNFEFGSVGHREVHYLLSGSADGVIMAWKIHPSQRIVC